MKNKDKEIIQKYTLKQILDVLFEEEGLICLNTSFKEWNNNIIKDRLKLNEDLRYLYLK